MFIRKESGNFMSRRAFPYRRKKFDTGKKFKKFKSSGSTRYSRTLAGLRWVEAGGQPVQYGFVLFGGEEGEVEGVDGSEAARDGDDAFSSTPESSRPSQAH